MSRLVGLTTFPDPNTKCKLTTHTSSSMSMSNKVPAQVSYAIHRVVKWNQSLSKESFHKESFFNLYYTTVVCKKV